MAPVQGGKIAGIPVASGSVVAWLAQEAYAEYARHGFGHSFEQIHERGGFGPMELLDLLAGGNGNGTVYRRLNETRDTAPKENSEKALHSAMAFAQRITTDQEWIERLALTILRAAVFFHREGIRPGELEQATSALMERKP
jgi:hypothetical protein